MMPPVPIESLPKWVQEILKSSTMCHSPVQLEIGDRVFGTLYAEENGTVIDVRNEDGKTKWCKVGWNLNPATGKYSKMAIGAPYYVKYPVEKSNDQT